MYSPPSPRSHCVGRTRIKTVIARLWGSQRLFYGVPKVFSGFPGVPRVIFSGGSFVPSSLRLFLTPSITTTTQSTGLVPTLHPNLTTPLRRPTSVHCSQSTPPRGLLHFFGAESPQVDHTAKSRPQSTSIITSLQLPLKTLGSRC